MCPPLLSSIPTLNKLHQVDIVSMYFQGDLDKDIYMLVPKGIKEPRKCGWYWKLKKVLYGLKQVGRQWKSRLNEVMDNLGFEISQMTAYTFSKNAAQ